MKVSIKFTVFFEGIFWVGVFERLSLNDWHFPKSNEVYANLIRLKMHL